MEVFVIFVAVVLSYSALIVGCKIEYHALGCYKDNNHKPRALPFEILNERDKMSKVYNNRSIDWRNWDEYIVGLACRCAQKAALKGYRVFGLQFYGECWSGPFMNSYKAVGRDDSYDGCVGEGYKLCSKYCTHCVGKQFMNFVYKIDKQELR